MELKVGKERATVLVIDDDREMLAIMASLLERMGYLVFQSLDIATAHSLVSKNSIDLILCDAHLKGESGCDLLRQPDKIRSLPVVMMTGCLEPDLKQEALLLGASGFLTKPFRIQELVQTLESAISSSPKLL